VVNFILWEVISFSLVEVTDVSGGENIVASNFRIKDGDCTHTVNMNVVGSFERVGTCLLGGKVAHFTRQNSSYL
jgi:hypothetical protein